MSRRNGQAYDSAKYKRARAHMLASGPLCIHCGVKPATRADHQPPLSLHRHEEGTNCCRLVPSCHDCERLQANLLSGQAPPLPPPPPLVEPEGFPVDSPVWDVPWLDEFRDVPEIATWPRLMTVPHPAAVATIGGEVSRFAQDRRGRPWRWWQRLAAVRLLEVDTDGNLVWFTAILTLARQLGKTWWLGDLCAWRLEQSHRFGAVQHVLSIGKDLDVTEEMQAPARRMAAAQRELYTPVETNGKKKIIYEPDGSEWRVKAQHAAYGWWASMATIDEAWKIPANVVDDGIVPTTLEQPQPQILFTSTAHRRATALMIGRRATALDQLANPGEDAILLMEWSAHRDLPPEDRAGWRQASPHWTPQRERIIAARLRAALAGESDDVDEPDPMESFNAQYRCIWPAKRLAAHKGEELVDLEVWDGAYCPVDSIGPLVVGVEDTDGHGSAVGFCGTLPDGRFVLGGSLRPTRAGAYRLAAAALDARPGSTLVVGASLFAEVETLALPAPVRRAGSRETGAALSLLRELLLTERVTQDGSEDLAGQVAAARVVTTITGLSLVAGPRSDLLRATVWALWSAVTAPALIPAIH